MDLFHSPLGLAIFGMLGVILLLYTATLFVLTPIAVPILVGRAWQRTLKAALVHSGWKIPSLVVALTVLAYGLAFLVFNRQPQRQAFALLREPPASTEAALALLKKQDLIRKGLLNSYLASFRYVSAEGEVRHMRDIYESVFGIRWENAYKIQRLYEGLARPLLYEPVNPPDPVKRWDNFAQRVDSDAAAVLYQRFFDTLYARYHKISPGKLPDYLAHSEFKFNERLHPDFIALVLSKLLFQYL